MLIPTTTTPGKQMNSVQMFTNTILTKYEQGFHKVFGLSKKACMLDMLAKVIS